MVCVLWTYEDWLHDQDRLMVRELSSALWFLIWERLVGVEETDCDTAASGSDPGEHFVFTRNLEQQLHLIVSPHTSILLSGVFTFRTFLHLDIFFHGFVFSNTLCLPQHYSKGVNALRFSSMYLFFAGKKAGFWFLRIICLAPLNTGLFHTLMNSGTGKKP